MSGDVDLLVLGGGCAGLALGRELAHRNIGLSTLIIEPRARYEEDRTWCFWQRKGETCNAPVAARWGQWRLSAGTRAVTHTGSEWHYAMVRSGAYYEQAIAAITASPKIHLQTGARAGRVSADDRGASIETGTGTIRARWVVDTRPPDRARLARSPLTQVFSGAEIVSDEDVFDPDTALVMDRLRSDSGQIAFDYILPLSSRRALIEHTVFSTRPLDPQALDIACDAEIDRRVGNAARFIRRERGSLPMGLPEMPAALGSIVAAGTRAGALRASSGYGFCRIQAWATACADELAAGRAPIPQHKDPAYRLFMDKVFLNALTHDLHAGPDIFIALADALPPDGFARFMSDAASPLDWMRTVLALPRRRFLSEALSQVFARHVRPEPAG
jgi:lycopene beta-cyclase